MSIEEHVGCVLSAWSQSLVEWTTASCSTSTAREKNLSQNHSSIPVHFDIGTRVLLRIDIEEEHSDAYEALLGTVCNETEHGASECFKPLEGYSQIADDDDDDDDEEPILNHLNESRKKNPRKTGRTIFIPGTIVECNWRNPFVST